MKKTKIICSMGPNTNDKELMKNMALSGMNIARFNFSHGDYEEHLGRYKILEERLGFRLQLFWIQRDQKSEQVFW